MSTPIAVLGPNVASVIGVSHKENVLFGIGADRRGYVRSTDGGVTWTMTNPGAWQAVKMAASTGVSRVCSY